MPIERRHIMEQAHPNPQADPACVAMLSKLFDEHYDFYLFRAQSILGSLADAQDVTQSACLKAWNRIEKLRTPFACASWFDRILVNECLYLIRQRNSRKAILDENPSFDPSPSTDISELSIDRWMLESLLSSVKQQYSEPLLLHYLYGYSTERIAEVLGISNRTVRHRITYGKQLMRSLYSTP